MPNWCKNVLKFPADFEGKFEKKHIVNGEFQFDTVVPVPEDLSSMEASSDVDLGYTLVTWKKSDSPTTAYHQVYSLRGYESISDLEASLEKSGRLDHLCSLGERAVANIEKYGHATWYTWAIENWGTKWSGGHCDMATSDGVVSASFSTAWSPPVPVIAALSALYPEVPFTLKYADDSDDLAGHCEFIGGKETVVYSGTCCEGAGLEIADELGVELYMGVDDDDE